jgi:hypothetical protein
VANILLSRGGFNGGAEVAETTVKKTFYASSFDALVKGWDMYINVGGGYVKK